VKTPSIQTELFGAEVRTKAQEMDKASMERNLDPAFNIKKPFDLQKYMEEKIIEFLKKKP